MFHEISCISIRSIMTLKEINIRYKEYGSMEELPEDDRILAQEAVKATGSSYSPYSGFHVGAALRLSNGEIVRGKHSISFWPLCGKNGHVLCKRDISGFRYHGHSHSGVTERRSMQEAGYAMRGLQAGDGRIPDQGRKGYENHSGRNGTGNGIRQGRRHTAVHFRQSEMRISFFET